MKIRLILIPVVTIVICLTLFKIIDKKTAVVWPIAKADSKNLKVEFFRKTFDIDTLIDSVSYVRLKQSPRKIGKIERLEYLKDRIFILGKNHSGISVFSSTGEFKYSINKPIDGFQIFKSKLVTYSSGNGLLDFYSLDGKYLYGKKMGIGSLECMVIDDSTFISYTAGLNMGKEKKQYEFAVMDQSLNIKAHLIPVPQARNNIDYYPGKRLYSFGGKIYFFPSFSTELNSIGSHGAKVELGLDFGQYTPSEENIAAIANVADPYIFPYIFDIHLLAETNRYRFYTFLFKKEVSYILEDKNKKKLITGIGMLTGKSTGYNDITPVGTFQNHFVAPVYENKEYEGEQRKYIYLMLYHLRY